MIETLISGGQTGVDRAALDCAIALFFPYRGWCPKGRKAEDGSLGAQYQLKETPSAAYQERTLWNVRDSDGTLVIIAGELEGGTRLTVQFAQQLQKPHLIVDVKKPWTTDEISQWIESHQIKALNVAGPRQSKQPNIYQKAYDLIKALLEIHNDQKTS